MTNRIQETDELARFRQEWRAEVEQRKRAATGESVAGSHHDDRPDPESSTAKLPSPVRRATQEPKYVASGRRPSIIRPSLDNPAVTIYRKAVAEEQRGEYEAAVQLYRQAFRLDPNVDGAYHLQEKYLTQTKTKRASETVDTLSQDLHNLTVHESTRGDVVASGSLATIVAQFPDTLSFEPEDERQGRPILNVLPDELLVYLLRKVDIATLERFATVCRRARVVTLDSSIWREIVLHTYKTPQITAGTSLSDLLTSHFMGDFRRMFVELPRVRLDGVYIAVCHYVRAGLSENSWVNVTHLITYHRYLRFYPNGQVLSLLANEEYDPQQIIPLLKPSLRMKGFYIGQWALEGDMLYITNLFDASGQHHVPGSDIPPVVSGHGHHGSGTTHPQPAKYVFQMTLHLKSRPMAGRWNKLDLKEYDSVNIETGEACGLPTKNDPPFWFSKVRSYAAAV